MRDEGNSPLKEQMVETGGSCLGWGTMARNVLRKRTGVVVTAVMSMYLNAKSEGLYKMRNSMLMKFPLTVTGGETSFSVAACVRGWRGLGSVSRMCLEVCGQSYVRMFVLAKSKAAVFRSLRRIFLVLVNVIKGFCHLQ